jgi:hypothetical protein
MKSPHPSKPHDSLFKQDTGEQPVRLIKAAQASKLIHGSDHGHSALNGSAELPKKPEIRMVHSGADYCDLEVICGCGESTQVRCWNTPPAEEKGTF